MLLRFTSVLFILGAVLAAAPAPQTKAVPPPKAAPPKAAAPKPGAAKSAPPSKSSPRATLKPTPIKPTPVKPSGVKPRRATPSKIGPRRAAAPPRQSQPSPERYKQIQQALIDKGFLNGEPTGQWDQRSIDALKKFEQSQQLKDDGKIDSMSLIGLGLGPKRTPLPTSPLPGAPAPPPAPQN
ncbi:MAG: peptidoglycan-binding protein [Acidobacteria bacterium]|nr:peptidoglycan-binding protein [Acidobacteriota bacterium]